MAGAVTYRLTVDKSDFERGLDEASHQWEEFTKQLASGMGLGAGFEVGKELADKFLETIKEIPAQMLELGAASAEYAEKTERVATALGMSTDAVERYSKMSQELGLEGDAITRTLGKLEVAIGKHNDMLARMGLSWQELKDESPEDAIREVGERIGELDNVFDRNAAAQALMGKNWQDTSAVVREMNESTEEFVNLSPREIEQLNQIKQAAAEAKTGWGEFKTQVGALIDSFPNLDVALKGMASGLKAIATELRGMSGLSILSTLQANMGNFAAHPIDFLTGNGKYDYLGADAWSPEMGFPSDAPAAPKPTRTLAPPTAKGEWAGLDKAASMQAIEDINAGIKAHFEFYKKSESAAYAETEQALREQHAEEKQEDRDVVDSINAAMRERKKAYDEETANSLAKTKELLQYQHEAFGMALSGVESFLGAVTRLGGTLGQIAGSLGGVLGGVGGIQGGLSAWGAAEKVGEAGGAANEAASLLGKIGAVGDIAGAAIGIGTAIVNLFKSDPVKKAQEEAGQVLGYGISRQLAQTLMDEAKASGESIQQVAREYQVKIDAGQKEANRQQLEGGLQEAQQGATTLLGLLDKLDAKAAAAAAPLIKGVGDSIMANGLGYLATGALAKNDQFTSAQAAVGASSQLIGGMTKAGGIDTALLTNAGQMAGALRDQATAAAVASGMTATDATKAGFATIAPLLKSELDASLASGKDLDANTKALIEEAKKNGIEILADPQIEMLQVLKDIRDQGRGMNGASSSTNEAETPTNSRISSAGGFGDVLGPRVVRGGANFTVHDGEGVLVVPKDRMARAGGFAHISAAGGFGQDEGAGLADRLQERSDARLARLAAAGTAAADASSPLETVSQQLADLQTTVVALQSAAVALAAKTPIQVTNAPSIQLVDQSAVKTAEGQRAMGRFVVDELNRALDTNSRGLLTRIQLIAKDAATTS
jgi:hypothetical protein